MTALVALPSVLSAHAKLVRSNPPSGATLRETPQHFVLVFTEAPAKSLSSVRLRGPVGDTITLNLSVEGDSVLAEMPMGLIPGRYFVLWSVAGRDGHPLRGRIDFTLLGRATSPPIQEDRPVPVSEPLAVGGAFGSIFARWLSFASIFLVIGVISFRLLILRRMSPGAGNLFTQVAEVSAATLGIAASVGALVGALFRITREAEDMPDVSLSSMLLDSWWGVSVLLQVIGAAGAGIALFFVHRSTDSGKRHAWQFAASFAAFLAIAPALGGHASTSEPLIVSIADDVLHVIAGSVWLGSLAVIILVGIAAALKTPDSVRPGERIAAMINTFSPIALTCGATMILTGIISAKFHIPSWEALRSTPYGVALLIKLFFVVLLFAAGAWNWKRMKPRLTGDDEISPMRSSGSLELVIASMVLAVTAILVALELP